MAFIQSKTGTDTSNANTLAITFTSTTAAGNLLIAVCANDSTGGTTVVDTVGNVWTSWGSGTNTSGLVTFWATNKAAGVTHKVTFTNTNGDDLAGAIQEWSGYSAIHLQGTTATGSSAAPTSNSITPNSGDLVFVAAAYGDSNATVGAGFSNLSTANDAFDVGIALESQVATGSITSGTFGITSSAWITAIAAFTPTSYGAAGPVRFSNPKTGPMAMRHSYMQRRPPMPQANIVQYVPVIPVSDSTATSESVTVQLVTPKIAALVDNFNGGTLSTATWNLSGTNSIATNQLVQTLAASSTTYNVLSSNGRFDATSSQVIINAINVGNQALASKEVFLEVMRDSSNEVFMYVQSTSNGGNLVAYKRIAGTSTVLATIPYNVSTQSWWRIRESAGVTYWDYGNDSVTWTNLFSVADLFDMSDVYVQISSGTYASEVSATSAIWDNLNISTTDVLSVSDSTVTSETITILPSLAINLSDSTVTSESIIAQGPTPLNVLTSMEQYYDIFCQGYVLPNSTTYAEAATNATPKFYAQRFYWDPAAYDNVTGVFFEAGMNSNTTGVSTYAEIYDITHSAAITGSEIIYPYSSGLGGVIRSTNFFANMPLTASVLTVYGRVNGSSTLGSIGSARLVVQQGATATKGQQTVVMASGDNTTVTTPTLSPWSNIWYYDSTSYNGITNIFFEFSGATVAANTFNVILYDKTAAAQVATISTSSTTFDFQRSSNIASLLVSGHEYMFWYYNTSSNIGSFGCGRIIIQQQNYTKTEQQITPIASPSNLTTTAYTTGYWETWTRPNYGNVSYAFDAYHEVVVFNVNGTAQVQAYLYNETTTSQVTGSGLTSVAGSTLQQRLRTAQNAFTLPASPFVVSSTAEAIGTTGGDIMVGRLVFKITNIADFVSVADATTTSETLTTPAVVFAVNVSPSNFLYYINGARLV